MIGCMRGALTCFTSVTPSASKPPSDLGITWGSECLWAAVWPRLTQTYTRFPDTSSLKMGKHLKAATWCYMLTFVYRSWNVAAYVFFFLKSSPKPFVAPEGAVWNLINCLKWCHLNQGYQTPAPQLCSRLHYCLVTSRFWSLQANLSCKTLILSLFLRLIVSLKHFQILHCLGNLKVVNVVGLSTNKMSVSSFIWTNVLV